MTHILVFLVAGVALVLLVEAVAEKSKLPAAALLTVVGLVYALLPGTNIALDPHVVLTFILPPLLYSAALNSSLLAIRKNLRPVISLSVFLVLATALLVGLGVHLLVPAITLAAGIALGAAVAPPDPVAALAIGRRAKLPPRLITLIEGEGLLNDATALTTFTVAVAAATSGGFSAPAFALRFLLASAGGLAVGIVVALLVRLLRSQFTDPLIVNSLSLVTPFGAYLAGEEIHVPGVLAVVVAGLIVGHESPRFSSGPSRLQSTAVWAADRFPVGGLRLPADRATGADRAGRSAGVFHVDPGGGCRRQSGCGAAVPAALVDPHPTATPPVAHPVGRGRGIGRRSTQWPRGGHPELGGHPRGHHFGGHLFAAVDHRQW